MTVRIFEVDVAELAVRMAEAGTGMRRPAGRQDPRAALEAMDDEVAAGFLREAQAALDYFVECAENAGLEQ